MKGVEATWELIFEHDGAGSLQNMKIATAHATDPQLSNDGQREAQLSSTQIISQLHQLLDVFSMPREQH